MTKRQSIVSSELQNHLRAFATRLALPVCSGSRFGRSRSQRIDIVVRSNIAMPSTTVNGVAACRSCRLAAAAHLRR